ncbi:MAG TPA: hypothetical protein VGP46_05115, partial [Acidimicrobiales bacterium]|nr:hypothetical protein [Acidimicrobiales bacterium]
MTMLEERTVRLLAGRPQFRQHLERFGPLPALDAAALLAELEKSGLSGRGGAGFPSWRKLQSVHTASRRHQPVVAINAMEGEPASDKEHVLISESAHLVLDGALALASALQACEIVACVPADRQALGRRLESAIAERPSLVPARVLRLAPRYVAGEESALVAAV